MKRNCACQMSVQGEGLCPACTYNHNPNCTYPAYTQMAVVRSTAASIPVMVYKLATGQFPEVPHPTGRPQEKKILPFTLTLHHSRTYPMPQSDRGLLGPTQGSAPENLLKGRKDWPITTTSVPHTGTHY